MVTDTAFYRYANHRSPQDAAEKIDYARMAQVVRGLARALVRLASDEAGP